MAYNPLDDIVHAMGQSYLQPFRAEAIDTNGGAGLFTTSQAKTVDPTLFFAVMEPQPISSGVIHNVSYRFNPTNAVTYTLRLWDGEATPAVDAYSVNARLIYESPTLQVDDTDYDDLFNIPQPFVLRKSNTAGPSFKLMYSVEWTGAPGVTPGYLKVEGLGAYV